MAAARWCVLVGVSDGLEGVKVRGWLIVADAASRKLGNGDGEISEHEVKITAHMKDK